MFNQTVDNCPACCILNRMVECLDGDNLSRLLKAVSDTTRRSLLTRLCRHGPMRVTDLAGCYKMSLNAVSKHIKVLEKAGLVRRSTAGRVHWIEPELEQVGVIEEWVRELSSIWELRLQKLDEILNTGDPDDD